MIKFLGHFPHLDMIDGHFVGLGLILEMYSLLELPMFYAMTN